MKTLKVLNFISIIVCLFFTQVIFANAGGSQIDFWDSLNKTNIIIGLLIPLVGVIGYFWKQRKRIIALERELENCRVDSRAYIGEKHSIDGIILNVEAVKGKIIDILILQAKTIEI